MKYFVKYLLKNTYTLSDKLTVKAGEEVEVSDEIFTYLTNTYGDSGMFTFRKEGKAEPEVVVEAEPEVEPVPSKKSKKKEVVEPSEK